MVPLEAFLGNILLKFTVAEITDLWKNQPDF